MLGSSTRASPVTVVRRFRDRRDAGERLGARVATLDLRDPLVLGLARGGVVVAAEVARALGAPLDALVVRKLGAPGQPELGVGALAETGEALVDESTLRLLGIDRTALDPVIARERAELQRRVARYRGGRALAPFAGRDVVVVDDGLATGVTARAALRAVRRRHPRRLVVAVPVGATDTVARLVAERDADDVVALETPSDFFAVGAWYDRFDQTSDDEVVALLADADQRSARRSSAGNTTGSTMRSDSRRRR
jgi:putative phosphoribosyl transferase